MTNRNLAKKTAIVAALLLGALTACSTSDSTTEPDTPTPTVQEDTSPTPAKEEPTEPEKPEEAKWEEADIHDGFVTPPNTTIIAPVEEVSAQGVNGWYVALDIKPGTKIEELYNNILEQFQERDIPASIVDPEDMVEPEVEGTGVILAEGENGERYERYSLEIIPPVGEQPGEIYWLAAIEPLPEPEKKATDKDESDTEGDTNTNDD